MQGEQKGRISVVGYFKGMGWGSVRGEGKAEFGQLETREKKKSRKSSPSLAVKCADTVETGEC